MIKAKQKSKLAETIHQINSWLESEQATLDVKKMLTVFLTKNIDEAKQIAQSLLSFEGTFQYKYIREELDIFNSNLNLWSRSFKKEFSDPAKGFSTKELILSFDKNKLPMSVAYDLRKAQRLQFFWDVETNQPVLLEREADVQNVPDGLMEIGIVSNLFTFTEKGSKKGITKTFLDYFFEGAAPTYTKMDSVSKKILKELKVDFDNIQNTLKKLIVHDKFLSGSRVVNYNTPDHKEVKTEIIIPSSLQLDQSGIQELEGQIKKDINSISCSKDLLFGYQSSGLAFDDALERLMKESRVVTYKNFSSESVTDKDLHTFVNLLYKVASPEIVTDEVLRSEVVTEVREFVYEENNFDKHVKVFLRYLKLHEVFKDEDALVLVQDLISSHQLFRLEPCRKSKNWSLDFTMVKNQSIATGKIDVGDIVVRQKDIFDSIKYLSEQLDFTNHSTLYFSPYTYTDKRYNLLGVDEVQDFYCQVVKEQFSELDKIFSRDTEHSFLSEIVLDGGNVSLSSFLQDVNHLLIFKGLVENLGVKKIFISQDVHSSSLSEIDKAKETLYQVFQNDEIEILTKNVNGNTGLVELDFIMNATIVDSSYSSFRFERMKEVYKFFPDLVKRLKEAKG